MQYAAIDGFVSFELYRPIKIIERGRTYCPGCLVKQEEEAERAFDAMQAKRCMPPPPGYVDDGAPSAPWGDVSAWNKKRQQDAAGGWGESSKKKDSAGGWGAYGDNSKKKKQDTDAADGLGSHVYP